MMSVSSGFGMCAWVGAAMRRLEKVLPLLRAGTRCCVGLLLWFPTSVWSKLSEDACLTGATGDWGRNGGGGDWALTATGA